jgi:hypothetical protein
MSIEDSYTTYKFDVLIQESGGRRRWDWKKLKLFVGV